MRQVLVLVLALSVSGAPVLAQSLHPASPAAAQPIQDSARAEVLKLAVAQGVQGAQGGMSPAYLWMSVALMSGGGLLLFRAARNADVRPADPGSPADNAGLCYSGNGADAVIDNCGVSKGPLMLGAGLVAAGVWLFLSGKKKAASPQIVFGPGVVGLRGQLTF